MHQEELVLSMQGIITQKDLPPMLKRYVVNHLDERFRLTYRLVVVLTTDNKGSFDRAYR
jgi:hypothetical protein